MILIVPNNPNRSRAPSRDLSIPRMKYNFFDHCNIPALGGQQPTRKPPEVTITLWLCETMARLWPGFELSETLKRF